MPRSKRRETRGQATLEAALLVPAVLVLVVTIFDVGSSILFAANLQSAADGAARAIESSRGAESSVEDVLDQVNGAYPNLAGRVTADVNKRAHEVTAIGYKLYNPQTGSFHGRPAHVGDDRYDITLGYAGEWLSPVMRAISQAAGGQGRFEVTASATATVDTTLEEW